MHLVRLLIELYHHISLELAIKIPCKGIVDSKFVCRNITKALSSPPYNFTRRKENEYIRARKIAQKRADI